MRRTAISVVFAVALTAACTGGDGATPTTPAPADTVPPSATAPETTAPPSSTTLPGTTPPASTTTGDTTTTTAADAPPEPFDGLALPADAGAFFSASGACAVCHQQMADDTGADVSVDSAWRSTMMANAARDPYWSATVRSEVEQFPALAAVIEDACSTCHMPMARTTAVFDGGAGSVLDGGLGDPGHRLAPLAGDGVSCALCHQIEPDGLGTQDSFSGGFAIDRELPVGDRPIYGPYDTPPGPAGVMQAVSGYVPVRGEHVHESTLCATCHTLYTPTVDGSGEIVGEFAEQTPYLEWEASAFGGAVSCQDCHLPEAAGSVQLSNTGGPPRAPFSQHHFVGGNVSMLSVFRAFGEDLEVTASSEQFDTTLGRVEEQLGERTAMVSIRDLAVADGQLVATVDVANLTGHKFPTGFPSRRAWLHVTVLDGSGDVVFESGAPEGDGSITGNDNDADPAAFEPHHARITAPGSVQIYEAIVGDTTGAVTTTLLRGAGYLKDNRLLPAGFDPEVASPDVLPAGVAAGDGDFLGGSDAVVYDVDVAGVAGPFTVEVELLYQPIGFRWIADLVAHEGPEIDRFAAFTAAVPNVPALVAVDAASVDG